MLKLSARLTGRTCRQMATYIKESHDNSNQPDEFTKEFLANRIEMSPFQKIFLTAGSSIAALLDPHRGDMIAALGETTGVPALENILRQMKSTEEGLQILTDKPRINSKTIDLELLEKLPENTFGKAYSNFLKENNVTPDSRLPVKFMESPELGYVMTRYRETHDLVHTVLGMPTNMLGEVSVKWIEAINTGLPMCYGGAVFGAIRLRPKQRKSYISQYLPWALKTGMNLKPLMSVYYEKRWEQDLEEFRKEINLEILKI